MSNYSDLSIIIPTLNERANLNLLIPLLNSQYPGAGIFISDDGSSDGTYELIKTLIIKKQNPNNTEKNNNLVFLQRQKNRLLTNNKDFNSELFYNDELNIRKIKGLTASVIDALYLIPTDKFTVIDADFQHPPELVGKMYSKLNKSDFISLVTGCRTKLKGFAFYRILLTKTGTFIAKSTLPKHSSVSDPLSGAFGGRINKLKNYLFNVKKFKLEGFKILFDLLKIIPPEIKISKANYAFKLRKEGASKIGLKQMFSFYSSVFDRKTRKLIAGVLLIFSIVVIANTAILIFGDINITDYLRVFARENPLVLNLFSLITSYGNYLYYILFASFIFIGIIKKQRKLLKVGLIYLVVQLIASGLITGGLKIIVGRPRPGYGFKHQFFTSRNAFKSFPSGHATDAFSSAGVL